MENKEPGFDIFDAIDKLSSLRHKLGIEWLNQVDRSVPNNLALTNPIKRGIELIKGATHRHRQFEQDLIARLKNTPGSNGHSTPENSYEPNPYPDPIPNPTPNRQTIEGSQFIQIQLDLREQEISIPLLIENVLDESQLFEFQLTECIDLENFEKSNPTIFIEPSLLEIEGLGKKEIKVNIKIDSQNFHKRFVFGLLVKCHFIKKINFVLKVEEEDSADISYPRIKSLNVS